MGDGKRSTKTAMKMAKWQYKLERRKARLGLHGQVYDS